MKALGMTFGESKSSEFYFFSQNITYHVTNFQRAYTWNQYQVKGFIEDLEYMLNTGLSIGWPSILLQESKKSNPNNNHYLIGDGQQRITTVFLALLALSQVARRKVGDPDPDEISYFNNLMYGSSPSSPGRLASYTVNELLGGVNVSPVLKFYSKKTNDALIELFSEPESLGFVEGEIEKAKHGIPEEVWSSEQNIRHNFSLLFDFFLGERNKEGLAVLKQYAEVILGRINLSALIYDDSEDMQRSFSRMNTYGMPLNPEELIKAELYGKIRISNEKLADEIVEYWTENLEHGKWSQKKYVSGRNAYDNSNASSHLEKFLVEFANVRTDWVDIIKRGKSEQRRHPQWLRDRWMKILDNMKPKEYRDFWKSFKSYLRVYDVATDDDNPYTSGSLDWEINYTAHMIDTQFKSVLAIIMKIVECSPTEEDAIASLVLLRKIYLYVYFVENDTNGQQRIVRVDSPLLNDVVNHKELLAYVESTLISNRAWLSEKRIAQSLERRIYLGKDSSRLNELFIFTANEEYRKKGQLADMFNPRDLLRHGAKESITREHILPQSPQRRMSEEEKAEYAFQVDKLGNSMPIARSPNSLAGTKKFLDKRTIYQKSASGWGVYWSNDLQSVVDKLGEDWWYNHITLRSKLVAEKMAKHLAPENPYSDFKVLCDNIEDRQELTTSMDDHVTVFTASKKGYLEDVSGEAVRTVDELKEACGHDESVSSNRVLKFKDRNNVFLGALKRDKVTQKPDFSKEGFARRKISLFSNYGEYQDVSASKLLIEYIRSVMKVDKQAADLALVKAGVQKQYGEIYKNSQLYIELETGGYIQTNRNQKDVEEIIKVMGEFLGDTLAFQWN